MATMHRELTPFELSALLIACLMAPHAAMAQTQQNIITPTLGVRLEHTDNVDGVSNSSTAIKRAEDILTVAPGLEVRHQGPHTQAEGRLGLLAEHRLQSTSSDRVVPDGRLKLRTEPGGRGAGLEASFQAQQVKSSVAASSGTSAATANSVTESQASLTPFLTRKLGEGHEFVARAQGLQTLSDPRLDTTRETRVRSFDAQIGLVRRPAPFGYALEATALRERQKAETPDASAAATVLREDGSTKQSAIRAALLYAFGPEMELGLIFGQEKDQRRLRTLSAGSATEVLRDFDGPFMGLKATWRPGPRTEFKGLVENREAARTWAVDASHRLRRTTISLSDRQVATRSAPLSVTDRSVFMPGGGLTPPPQLSAAQPLPGESTALLSVQRTSGLRVTYEGVRTVLSLLVGQFRARSLISTGGSSGADRSRYHGMELTYRLTPQLSSAVGLRWNRATDAAGLSRKEQLATMGLRLRLSPTTSLDGGAAILTSRSKQPLTSTSELTQVNSVYARLEHRF